MSYPSRSGSLLKFILLFLGLALAGLTFSLIGAAAYGQSIYVGSSNEIDGLVLTKSGKFQIRRMTLRPAVKDEYFNYWAAMDGNDEYWYDEFNSYWVKAPITYKRDEIAFREKKIAGFFRKDGFGKLDKGFFFSDDHRIYRLVRELKKSGRKYKVDREYYIDIETKERGIDAPADEPTEDSDHLLIVEEDAFPNWK